MVYFSAKAQLCTSKLLTRQIFPALVYVFCAVLAGGLFASTTPELLGMPFGGASVQAAARPCDGCERTFEIGRSVRGQPIVAYQFGQGKHPIVYLGGMHGDELNSRQIMEQWRDELRAAPDDLFRDRSVVVVPSVNPDGAADKSRLNARGVDLNRNFAAKDWKQHVTLPNQPKPTGAGGRSPLSEPESKALAQYLRAAQPRLVLSYHSQAAVTEANEAGESKAVAHEYADRAGYRAVPRSANHKVFTYDTTGAMEDWLREEYGVPVVVVELASSTDSEYVRNKDALWYTFRQ